MEDSSKLDRQRESVLALDLRFWPQLSCFQPVAVLWVRACWAGPACSFPCPAASWDACSSEVPSTGHCSMSQQPSSALSSSGDTMKAERASAGPQKRTNNQSSRSQGKQGFSEDCEDSFGGLGAFCLFVFPKFLLPLFSSSNTGSQLHKPPVGSHCHHSGIPTSWGHVFLILWKLSCENCLVYTRRHSGGKKKSPSC